MILEALLNALHIAGLLARSQFAVVCAATRLLMLTTEKSAESHAPYDPSMSVALFAVVVIAFVVVARLPLDEGERVILEEEGLKLFHRFRRTAAHGGGTVTHGVRSVLTNRRVLLATGGPEREHKFVILMILDYTSAAPPVPATGYAAYRRKFGLQNGYPTYAFSAPDVSVEEHDGEKLLRVVIPFAEAGERWGDPPEVRLSTAQATRYEEAIAGTPG